MQRGGICSTEIGVFAAFAAVQSGVDPIVQWIQCRPIKNLSHSSWTISVAASMRLKENAKKWVRDWMGEKAQFLNTGIGLLLKLSSITMASAVNSNHFQYSAERCQPLPRLRWQIDWTLSQEFQLKVKPNCDCAQMSPFRKTAHSQF